MRLLHIFDLKCCRATSGGNGGLSAIHRKLVFFFEWVVKVKPFFLCRPGQSFRHETLFASGRRQPRTAGFLTAADEETRARVNALVLAFARSLTAGTL
jgi:hypothetical protein